MNRVRPGCLRAAVRAAPWVVVLTGALFIGGCGKTPVAEKTASAPVSAAAPVPDVGKVESVRTTAQGFGATAGEAVAEAMKLAILQVNGASLQSSRVSAKYGLDMTLGQDSASLRATSFSEVVRQRSGGVIQDFRVLGLQEPSEAAGNRYKATIEANIARFAASADMQKIKVVIGAVQFDNAELAMGDRRVSSAEVGETLRQRIAAALVQTGRFAVLDRESSPEIARELDLIQSGQAPASEQAKLSQAASADIVWTGRASSFAYNRHARQLRTSDRELVSYSGGWALSQKLVNVATRQVIASESLKGGAPTTEATTLGRGVDGDQVLQDMSTDLVNQVVASVLLRTFPVTVVARDGEEVVLSQGGQALKEGAVYAMVAMGAEMKDPQTGQSLGRIESPCCELRVERVTPNLSYGRLENLRTNLEKLPLAGLQLRGQLRQAEPARQVSAGAAAEPGQAMASAPALAAVPAAVPVVRPPGAPARSSASASPASPASPPATDDKW